MKRIILVFAICYLVSVNIVAGETYWVYQEDANYTDCSNEACDGDWLSGIPWGSGDFNFNYSLPANILGALWQIKRDFFGGTTNITIPSGCIVMSPLRLNVHQGMGWVYSCWNYSNSDFSQLYEGEITGYFDEEGVWFNLSDLYYIYQEDPDQEDVGIFSQITDGDWETYVSLSSFFGYVNYSKPAMSYGCRWKMKDGAGETQVQVPGSCWDYDNDKLMFRIYANGLSNNVWSCFNSDWQTLRSEYDWYIYEESVIWEINSSGQVTGSASGNAAGFELNAVSFLLSGIFLLLLLGRNIRGI